METVGGTKRFEKVLVLLYVRFGRLSGALAVRLISWPFFSPTILPPKDHLCSSRNDSALDGRKTRCLDGRSQAGPAQPIRRLLPYLETQRPVQEARSGGARLQDRCDRVSDSSSLFSPVIIGHLTHFTMSLSARSLPLPSHASFQEIFSTLPLLDPPKSRYPPRNPPPATPTAPPPPTNVFSKYLPAFLKRSEPPVEVKPKGMATNPFPTLKQGDKSFVLAVVDGGGSVSWLKFGRGLFGEWTMQ